MKALKILIMKMASNLVRTLAINVVNKNECPLLLMEMENLKILKKWLTVYRVFLKILNMQSESEDLKRAIIIF